MSANSLNNSFGLLASGSSRCWDVAIDESLVHDEWIAEIEGPHVYVTFQLRNIDVVSEVIGFLGQHPDDRSTSSNRVTQSPITLGKFGQAAVSLVWDNEGFNRCFLIIGAKGRSSVRITLLEDDINMLREAFRQVASGL